MYIDRWRSYIASYTSVSSPPATVAPTTYHFVIAGNSYKGLNRIREQTSVPPKVG